MGPRMVFRKSLRLSSARESTVQSELNKVEKPAPSTDPEAYPFGVGHASIRHVPIRLLVEDNVALDYMLTFARKEFSSELLELLAAHREMERERTRMAFAPDPLHVRQLLSDMLKEHVTADAPMQVTLPGSAVTALRKWLDDFLALGPKDQAALPLPMKDVETSIKQCLVRVGSVPARRA